MAMSDHHECDQCGLCCEKLIVEAEHYDALREPRIATECKPMNADLSLDERMWLLACGDAHPCPFASRDKEGKHLCDIYSSRPHTCVCFLPGGDKCQELRRDNGLPELQPIGEAETKLRHRLAVICGGGPE